MLQIRRQLPELLARVESSLTASTARAWETIQKREKITAPVVNNQVRQKLPGVLTSIVVDTRGYKCSGSIRFNRASCEETYPWL